MPSDVSPAMVSAYPGEVDTGSPIRICAKVNAAG